MKQLLTQYENKNPEIVFHWNDSETEAEGGPSLIPFEEVLPEAVRACAKVWIKTKYCRSPKRWR